MSPGTVRRRVLIASLLLGAAYAATRAPPVPAESLTPNERAALALAEAGMADTVRAVKGGDGGVRFVFGRGYPIIVCAIEQVCDIRLQPGETVNTVKVGDAARWHVESAVTGTDEQFQLHVVVKPLEPDTRTTLLVTTDRRAYRLGLRATAQRFMPSVSFSYPDDVQAHFEGLGRPPTRSPRDGTGRLPATGASLAALDFGFDLVGDAPWKPLRVYTDGVQTVIELPPAAVRTDAPALVLLRDGTPSETVVNYRVHGDRYRVDAVIDRAMLMTGVGADQTRVTITRKKARRPVTPTSFLGGDGR